MKALKHSGKLAPYNCPGCDREAYVWVTQTTLHRYGDRGLVYSISCRSHDDKTIMQGGATPNACLGAWFRIRPFQTETSAVSEWNNCIIEMAAAALGITVRQALALKERRAQVSERAVPTPTGEARDDD